MTRLATARLALEPVAEADAAFMLELLNDPGWIANIGDRGVRTLEAARAYVDERMASGLWWVVRDRAGAPLGLCGLVEGRDGLEAPDLGYAFLERHCGQGYATEAAGALLGHLRDTLGLTQLCAVTDLQNAASQRVLIKIGFTPAGERHLPGLGPKAYFVA